MSRRIALVVALALAAGGCATDLGPGTPGCRFGDTATATIVQLQAVPDAAWGPCIAELMVGWEYEAQIVKRGEAKFWLDSDRMGDRFVEVTLLPACTVEGRAEPAQSPRDGVERFIAEDEAPGAVEIAVVPVAPRHVEYGAGLVAGLSGQRIEGRVVEATLHTEPDSAPERVDNALGAGLFVIVVDDREMASNPPTVELRMPNGDTDDGLRIDQALEEIGDELGALRYRATWYHSFEGGCIVYEFDASGQSVLTLPDDIDQALGFFPLAELRRAAAIAGFEV